MSEQVSRILSMVDLCGGTVEKKNSFVEIVKRMLPDNIRNKDRYVQLFEGVVKSLANNQYFSKKDTILPCVFQAVKFGLSPDPCQGLIYFVPYKGVCTYQLGFKGLIQLARNSGEVKDIRAGLVYEEEKKGGMWNYFEDEKGQHFFHNPSMEKDKGALHCGYSIVTMRDGSNFVHVMEAHRIEAIKKMSLQRTPNSPWSNDLFCPEMMKKTVIRRHCKTLPSSVEMALAIEHEETVERGESVKYQTDEINSIIDQMDVSEIEMDDAKNEAALKELMK